MVKEQKERKMRSREEIEEHIKDGCSPGIYDDIKIEILLDIRELLAKINYNTEP